MKRLSILAAGFVLAFAAQAEPTFYTMGLAHDHLLSAEKTDNMLAIGFIVGIVQAELFSDSLICTPPYLKTPAQILELSQQLVVQYAEGLSKPQPPEVSVSPLAPVIVRVMRNQFKCAAKPASTPTPSAGRNTTV